MHSKFLINRKRPLEFLDALSKLSQGPGEVLDPGFPSAHTLYAFMMATLLEDVLSRVGDESFFNSPAAQEDEDVHAFVERELVARIGDAGRRLHTGRSRNEQVAVDLRLYLKRRMPALQQSIVALARSSPRVPTAPATR